MSRLTKEQHGFRAGAGIGVGIAFALAGAIVNGVVVAHTQQGTATQSQWLLLFAPVLPLLAWGCAHLARYRGYSSGVSYGIIALVLAGSALAIPALTAKTAGVVIVAASVVPPSILMTLNIRPGNFKSSREK